MSESSGRQDKEYVLEAAAEAPGRSQGLGGEAIVADYVTKEKRKDKRGVSRVELGSTKGQVCRSYVKAVVCLWRAPRRLRSDPKTRNSTRSQYATEGRINNKRAKLARLVCGKGQSTPR